MCMTGDSCFGRGLLCIVWAPWVLTLHHWLQSAHCLASGETAGTSGVQLQYVQCGGAYALRRGCQRSSWTSSRGFCEAGRKAVCVGKAVLPILVRNCPLNARAGVPRLLGTAHAVSERPLFGRHSHTWWALWVCSCSVLKCAAVVRLLRRAAGAASRLAVVVTRCINAAYHSPRPIFSIKNGR